MGSQVRDTVMLDVRDCGHTLALHNVLQSIAEQRLIAAYLEVGVCGGKSLEQVLLHRFPERLTLCDTWGGEYGGEAYGGPQHIHRLLHTLGYRQPVQFLNGNSHDLLKTVRETFDLILVDGDHSAAGARQDLDECWPLLQSGGLLVFDDLMHPSHPELFEVWRQFYTTTPDAWMVYEDVAHPMGVGVLCKTS